MQRPRALIYEFGEFLVDVDRRLLLGRDGRPLSLTPKVFDTLLYLVEHTETVLDKDTLMNAIWPGTAVEENSLNQNISLLRRVLGGKRSEHRYIVTVPGHGYRFVASVKKRFSTATTGSSRHHPARRRAAFPAAGARGAEMFPWKWGWRIR